MNLRISREVKRFGGDAYRGPFSEIQQKISTGVVTMRQGHQTAFAKFRFLGDELAKEIHASEPITWGGLCNGAYQMF